jgi:hypothetical protein
MKYMYTSIEVGTSSGDEYSAIRPGHFNPFEPGTGLLSL